MLQHSVTAQTGFAHLTDLPCIRLQYGTASAIISLYGAQLMSYQPAPGKELLWLSPMAKWQNQTPIRGGVPICWPWFGPADPSVNPAQCTLSNHGLIRTRLWQLASQQQTAAGISVTLHITLDELPHCTDPVSVQLELCLAETLSITLRCETPLLQQAALHSYFAVTDITQAKVWPLPQQYHDKVSGQYHQALTDCVQVDAEVDRVYAQTPSVLHISDNSNQLKLTQQGQDATVIWNPWQERSRAISDLPDDGYQRFLCVETARLQLSSAAPLYLTQRLQYI